MDIRRFGPGHRRGDSIGANPGVEGAVIHHDERALISELSFGRYAMVTPHSNPNTTLFIVISGGGFVQVGDERTRVNHGEAVLWPANVPHGAYTDGSEMRALVIEIPADDANILAGAAAATLAERTASADTKKPAEQTTGRLAERVRLRSEYDSSEGEPW